MPLSKRDHAALLECLRLGQHHPEIGRAPPDSGEHDWYARATWACYVLQYRDLNLRPWEPVPYEVDPAGTDERDAAARVLLRRMLAMGLSRFDPNPSQALQFA
jgi:hypothetical protein